jgi:hypothetical protein
MNNVILGISPFYHKGAIGHYERVHSSLNQTFQNQISISNKLVMYFGLEGHKDSPGYASCVGKSFQNPSGKTNFREIVLLSNFITENFGSDEVFIQIYEGSLSFYLAIEIAKLSNPNIYAIINFHQVELFSNLLKNTFVKNVYKIVLSSNLGVRTKTKLTAESAMSAKQIGEKIDENLEVFPVFTTFSRKKILRQLRKNLILISGDFNESQILKDISIALLDGGDSVIFDRRIREFGSAQFYNKLNLLGFKVVDELLSEEEYENLLNSIECVWYLYRSEVNLQGSSGRLMDALVFDLDVVVPSGSALEETVLEYRDKVKTINLTTGEIKTVNSLIRRDNMLFKSKNSVEFAANDLIQKWKSMKFEFPYLEANKKKNRVKIVFLMSLIFIKWSLLQLALFWYENTHRFLRHTPTPLRKIFMIKIR